MKLLYELYGQDLHDEKLLDVLMKEPGDTPLMRLRNILASGRELNNTETMLEIYGRINREAFSVLKRKLRDILVKSLATKNIDLYKNEDITNDTINVYRETLVSLVMTELNERQGAIRLLEDSLQKSIKYELISDIRLRLRLLLYHYSNIEYNQKKYDKYSKLYDNWTLIEEGEAKASKYRNLAIAYHRRNIGSFDKDFINKLLFWIDTLDRMNDINTIKFNLYRFWIKHIYYESIKDYGKILEACQNFEIFLYKRKKERVSSILGVYIRKLWALIQLKKYDECILEGGKAIAISQPGSINWFVIYYYIFKTHIYSKNYIAALNLLNHITAHRKFKALDDSLHELFNLFIGYMHLLSRSGIDPQITDMPLPAFRLGKFLNETPIYSKDKRGINVSILLLHVAFLLQRKDTDQAIDRIESLNGYAGRYLRRNDTFRSNCIIKMLVQMSKAGFSYKKTERYAATLRAQLDQVPLSGSGGNIEVEVIPFEVLWDIMMRAIR